MGRFPLRLCLLLQLQEEEQREESVRFAMPLDAEGRRRRDRRIPRVALQDPYKSAFATLFESGSDQALITFTGYDHEAFHALHELFAPVWNAYSPYSSNGILRLVPTKNYGGRSRSINSTIGLAIVLAWTRTRGATWVLSMLFGVSSSPLSLWLRFGRRVINRILHNHPDARVRFPDDATIQKWKEAIVAKYDALTNVYAAVDGLKLYLQQAGDDRIQNYFYNGWQCDHYVSNLFCFAPDGTIPACTLDCPGVCHDSDIACIGGMYELLQRNFDRNGGMVVMDSAFHKSGYPYIIKSGQEIRFEQGVNEARLDKQATSARQFANVFMKELSKDARYYIG